MEVTATSKKVHLFFLNKTEVSVIKKEAKKRARALEVTAASIQVHFLFLNIIVTSVSMREDKMRLQLFRLLQPPNRFSSSSLT
jgi:hypothetical protein